MTSRALSRSVEDYLKAIYGISENGEPATTSAIAEALDIQPASVTGMVKKLAESGLLEHVPYKGVMLTGPGTLEALRVLRRHRILETYLCERLGFSWDDVHDEAERLEHSASDQLIEQMSKALGFPSHDPHGAPIPTPGVSSKRPILRPSPTQPRETGFASERFVTRTRPTCGPWRRSASCPVPG